ERRPHAGRGLEVLDRVGNAVQQAAQVAAKGARLGRLRLLAGQVLGDGQVRGDGRVELGDAIEHGVGELDRREGPRADEPPELGDGGEAQIGRAHFFSHAYGGTATYLPPPEAATASG